MRLVLVVLFFVLLHISLWLRQPAEPKNSSTDSKTDPQRTGTVGPALPPAPPRQTPNPELSTGATTTPFETAEEALAPPPPPRSGEAERPGEQHTSQQGGPPKPDEVEAAIQTELNRLGCFSGRPERGWGPRSRAALRRFAAKAKPKEGNRPSEALLRSMRGYPANYCKRGNRATRQRAEATQKPEFPITPPAPLGEVAPELSYLPPWMVAEGKITSAEETESQAAIAPEEQVAKVEEKVRTDAVAHASPSARVTRSARPKRRKRAVKRPRPFVFRSVRRFSASPSFRGWPGTGR